jgi:hypothetical protein
VLSAAQTSSSDSNRLRLEVGKFLDNLRGLIDRFAPDTGAPGHRAPVSEP